MMWLKSTFIAFIISQKIYGNITVSYSEDKLLKNIEIKNHGRIEYFYNENKKLIQINRINENGYIQYFANYEYDKNGNLSVEHLINNLGVIYYDDKSASSSYHFESYEKIDDEIVHYLDNFRFNYPQVPSNNLNNQPFTYIFDDEMRLIESKKNDTTIQFLYEKDKRTKIKLIKNKITEKEIYYSVNGEEIAIFDQNNSLIELKIPGLRLLPGLSKPIAIEKNGKIYSTICDKFLNIYKLIDIDSKETFTFLFDIFGNKLSVTNFISKFSYRGKFFDSDLNLFYFGHRYYNLETISWISEDPIGDLQNKNLYCYCDNKPWQYLDPDGRFYFVIPISGSTSFESSLKTTLINFGLSLINTQLIDDCNTWLNKKLDERKMEKFVKKQKRTDYKFL